MRNPKNIYILNQCIEFKFTNLIKKYDLSVSSKRTPVQHVKVQCLVDSSIHLNHMLTLSLYNNSTWLPTSLPSLWRALSLKQKHMLCWCACWNDTVVLVGWTTSLQHISYTDDWINFVSTACIPSTVSSLTTQLTCLLYKATTITDTGNPPYQPPPSNLLMLNATQRTVWQHVLPLKMFSLL